MRAHEFVMETASVGATSAGNVATVAMPLGGMQKRNGGSFFTGNKYSNSATPNTPAWMKKLKGKSRA
jgi:hypothetical protein